MFSLPTLPGSQWRLCPYKRGDAITAWWSWYKVSIRLKGCLAGSSSWSPYMCINPFGSEKTSWVTAQKPICVLSCEIWENVESILLSLCLQNACSNAKTFSNANHFRTEQLFTLLSHFCFIVLQISTKHEQRVGWARESMSKSGVLSLVVKLGLSQILSSELKRLLAPARWLLRVCTWGEENINPAEGCAVFAAKVINESSC